MEHKLITGGEQWLPFARSRIKALRATGLAYASQKFEIEGALIDVRIEPGHEHIRIEGGGSTAYLETGVLTWEFHGINDPKWGEAAKWRFVDIQTNLPYLGTIVAGGADVGKQKNEPELSDGQWSRAIGYPKAKAGSTPEIETKNAETERKYLDSTLVKKKVMSAYPSSLFSGKMRLYMQSLYGAREPESAGDLPFFLDETTDPPIAMFNNKVGSGSSISVRPDSMGIFTAPDNTYWLLDINEGPGKVLVFKIDTSATKGLVDALRDHSSDRVKLESYIFANSKLVIPDLNGQIYAKGSFNMVPGEPLAYGWKWNNDGTRASIVVHEEKGDDIIANIRWRARTVHLTFSYSKAEGISVSSQVIDHGDWIDGWGTYNIFVPPAGNTPAPLALKSLRVGSGEIPPDFDFPATPIYGWYVDDVWTSASIDSTLSSKHTVTNSSSGLFFPNGIKPEPPNQPFIGGKMDGFSGCSWSVYESTVNGGRSFSFGGFSWDGRSFSKNTNSTDWTFGREYDDNMYDGQAFEWWGLWIAADGPVSSSTFKRISAIAGSVHKTIWQHDAWGTSRNTGRQQSCYEARAFAIVIPGCDCEALYLARYRQESAGTTVTETTQYDVEGQVYWYSSNGAKISLGGGAGWVPAESLLTMPPGSQSGWMAGGTMHYGPPTVSVSSHVPAESETDVICFNRKKFGVKGIPGGSYYALFNCSYLYPYYDRGMYTFTSHGGWYVMSEAPSMPSNLPSRNFVGWV